MPPFSPSDPSAPGGPPRLVCRCVGVSSLRIASAVETQASFDFVQIQAETRAGTGCGRCEPEIREILSEFSGKEIPEAERRLSLQWCQSETLARVEAALYSGVVPKLAFGIDVDLISVDGLTVDLHLLGSANEEIRAFIREKLRRLVCSDLEIRFS
ncbi:MAG: hypothetical protein GY725_10910 [bacterium]|nr:hypothetical protein [bacterium]